MNIPDIHQSIENNRQSILKHFYQFLQMPSISANPENKNDLHKTAQWLVSYCQSIGFKTQLLQTPGAPVVFAEHCPFPDKPILLIYGHYDVQPVDPISEWMSPPFSPKINGNMIYARGASDDKGQVFSFLKAIEFIYFKMGTLPVNLKIVIEGEEEIGCINFLTPILCILIR
jgi:acetylornithine deacetylase/succinyl-diaminopimelate desuccinylase-like protein